MSPQELEKKLKTLAPQTEAQVIDLTGTQDHYEATIVSSVFEGKMRIERHRMVMDLMKKELETGEVHALTMKTWTPAEIQKQKH